MGEVQFITHLWLSSVATRFTKDRKSQQKFMHTVGFQQLCSFCKIQQKTAETYSSIYPNVEFLWLLTGGKIKLMLKPQQCTLMSWETLEIGKVSTETTVPPWSLNPATTRGTPGRKDWAHHLSSLNLTNPPKLKKITFTIHVKTRKKKHLISFHQPVEVAALFGCADLQRGF